MRRSFIKRSVALKSGAKDQNIPLDVGGICKRISNIRRNSGAVSEGTDEMVQFG